MSKKIFSILCIVFIPLKVSSTVRQVDDNVYAGQCKNMNGKVYVGMELVSGAKYKDIDSAKEDVKYGSYSIYLPELGWAPNLIKVRPLINPHKFSTNTYAFYGGDRLYQEQRHQ